MGVTRCIGKACMLVLFLCLNDVRARYDISNSLEYSPSNSSRDFKFYHEALQSKKPKNFGWRIIGGELASITDVPYVVLYGWVCGGTLIAPNWVLTAAHCKISNYVQAGSEIAGRTKEYAIQRHVYHDGWFEQKPHYFDFDYLLLQLTKSIPVTPSTQPIAIGWNEDLKPGQPVLVCGWGHMEYKFNILREESRMTDRLRSVWMKTISLEECAIRDIPYYSSLFNEPTFVTQWMGCARAKKGGSCFGDSGGPVVANNKLVGVVSWGLHCEPILMFSNVPKVRDWIRKTTGLFHL